MNGILATLPVHRDTHDGRHATMEFPGNPKFTTHLERMQRHAGMLRNEVGRKEMPEMIDAHTEIDFKTASSWWPEISNKWTPVAWRDHRFRFTVLWNGSVMVIPWPTSSQRAEDLKNEPSFHLNIISARDEELPGEWAVAMRCRRVDDRLRPVHVASVREAADIRSPHHRRCCSPRGRCTTMSWRTQSMSTAG